MWVIAPTLALFAMSCAYALLGPKRWRGTQVLHVREEMIGQQRRPGHFDSLDDMKTAQETVLEVARNPAVVGRCLTALDGIERPTIRAIEQLQGQIEISASNGAELGKTELIRLSVVERTPDRARILCEKLAGELEQALRSVRFKRASSMVAELEQAAAAAQRFLDEVATQIKDFELQLGAELPNLRHLIEPTSGDNDLQRTSTQIATELRAAESSLESIQTQRKLLQEALTEFHANASMPNELLTEQPALKRLKDGLVDAQLKLASLRGDYHDNHPKVAAAEEFAAAVARAIQQELAVAIRGLSDQIQIDEAHVAHLQRRRDEVSQRLRMLTEQRVVYDQLNAEFKRRDEILRDAQTAVAQAESIKAAAQHVDFLTRVGAAQVGSRPEGISKRALVGAWTIMGWLIGIGLVMMVAGPQLQSRPARISTSETPSAGVAAAQMGPTAASAPPATQLERSQPRETVDQLLDRGSFAVTVMPANFLFSKPYAD
jgi:uncharacterized protein involved in exopolysaccharide biosynthesis